MHGQTDVGLARDFADTLIVAADLTLGGFKGVRLSRFFRPADYLAVCDFMGLP